MFILYSIARECLPFVLRDFKMRRPELVFILALNPEVRDLFSLVPCNVLFVMDSPYFNNILYILVLNNQCQIN